MVTSAEIYVLILTLGSLFTVPQCLSVPVHSMGRCPTMNCTGDMYMHALLEQDQLEHMQFTPFNAAASPSTGTSARNSAGSRLLAAPLSSPPPFSFEMTMFVAPVVRGFPVHYRYVMRPAEVLHSIGPHPRGHACGGRWLWGMALCGARQAPSAVRGALLCWRVLRFL